MSLGLLQGRRKHFALSYIRTPFTRKTNLTYRLRFSFDIDLSVDLWAFQSE